MCILGRRSFQGLSVATRQGEKRTSTLLNGEVRYGTEVRKLVATPEVPFLAAFCLFNFTGNKCLLSYSLALMANPANPSGNNCPKQKHSVDRDRSEVTSDDVLKAS
jgi:hypothetical protein